MKQILSVLILIAALVSLGTGGTIAHWVVSDNGTYAFKAAGESGEWENDLHGNHGWWKSWPNHLDEYPNLYYDIYFWLNEMNNPLSEWYSDWLMPDMNGDTVINVADLELLIAQSEGPIAEHQFLMQYVAQRLNQMSGRQSPSSRHNVTLVPTYDEFVNYLGLVDPYNATGEEILQKIEAKHGAIELLDPDAHEFDVMKDVCDWLNNLWM